MDVIVASASEKVSTRKLRVMVKFDDQMMSRATKPRRKHDNDSLTL